MPTDASSYGAAGNRMYKAPGKKEGGRFGGPQKQHTGKSGRSGMAKGGKKLTISDYDKAKV